MLVVPVPQNLSLTKAISFCNRLWKLGPAEGLTFDFKRLRHIEPFTMAFVAAEIARFRRSRPQTRFVADNFRHHSYAAHMGFFKAFGLDHGNDPGQARGSSTYIPLTIIDVADLQQRALASYEPIGNIVESDAKNLATILTRQKDGELVDALTYSLREILRNVVEHSESAILEYCAQYWPTQHKVEIAVLDAGIGIRSALSNNPHLQVTSDREALQLALMPGISGKMFKGVRRRSNDIWQNNGFGLYMTARLCRNGGSFLICSGASGVLLEPNQKIALPTSFKGTALRMVMDTKEIGGLQARLQSYKNDGFRLAKAFSRGTSAASPTASTMLARDFPEDPTRRDTESSES